MKNLTVEFFQDFGISVKTSGAEVTRGWINMRCPFCDDRKTHLGYNPKKGVFNCWRCGHKNVRKVIETLTGRSYKDIQKIYGEMGGEPTKEEKPYKYIDKIKLPLGLVKITKNSPFHKYLYKRGYKNIKTLIDLWNIEGINQYGGKYRWSLFIPVYFQNELVTFQTRSISQNSPLRYNTNPDTNSIKNIKEILYGYDYAWNNVVVMEGVLDVWKFGSGAVSTFGVLYKRKQVELLRKFKKVYVLFDNDYSGKKMGNKLAEELCLFTEVEIIELLNYKDFGEVPDELIQEIKREIYK